MLGPIVCVPSGICGLPRKGEELKLDSRGLTTMYLILTQSYHNWRWLAQYIDFALLDIQTLQYKNRTLAAAFLYLTLTLKLELHSIEEVSTRFKK